MNLKHNKWPGKYKFPGFAYTRKRMPVHGRIEVIMNYLQSNLDLLKLRFGITFNSKNIDNHNYIIEEGRDGKKVVKINRDDRVLYLGSRYDQQKDLDGFVSAIATDDVEKYIIIVGFGLGYHVRETLKNIGNNRILILESDAELLKVACSALDLRDIFQDKRIYLALYDNEEHLNAIYSQYIDISYSNSIVIESYHNYSHIYPEKVKMAYDILKKYQVIAMMNRNTAMNVSNIYIENFFLNLPHMIKGYSVENLKDAFKGKTAIVISAGPSLSRNMKFLRGREDNAVLITGGRNLRGLIKEGIKPHIVCAGDAGLIMHELMKDSYDTGVPFLLSEQACSVIADSNKGANIFDAIIFKEASKALSGKTYAGLKVAGTVATLCISLAVYMGCLRIIFVGQDLAYTDDKYHAPEASIVDGTQNTITDLEGKFYVEGNEEEKVLTDYTLNTFRLWIEDFIKLHKHIEFINCTEGGAKIRGTKIQKLQEALDRYCTEDGNPKIIIENRLAKKEKTDKALYVNKLEEFKRILEKIKAESKKAYDYSNDIYDYYDKNRNVDINHIFKELEKVNKCMENNRGIKEILDYVSYHFLDDFMSNPRLRERKDDSQKELGIKLAMRNQLLYGGIYESVGKIINLADMSIKKLEETDKKHG